VQFPQVDCVQVGLCCHAAHGSSSFLRVLPLARPGCSPVGPSAQGERMIFGPGPYVSRIVSRRVRDSCRVAVDTLPADGPLTRGFAVILDLADSGRPAWGSRGREFKSRQPDKRNALSAQI